MVLTGIGMLQLLPRQTLFKLGCLALVLTVVTGFSTPADARTDREVRRIKKRLVKIESLHDERIETLDRLGARWDKLEEDTSGSVRSLASFATRSLASIEQAHVEGLLLQARASIDALEERREQTIEELESIVVQRRSKRLSTSGLEPATMPSIDIKGSLVTYSADWEQTAMCESTKRWHVDSRYDGGLQFDPITWIEFGGAEFARYAHQATKMEQIAVAERVLAIQGPRAWPICFAPLPNDADG